MPKKEKKSNAVKAGVVTGIATMIPYALWVAAIFNKVLPETNLFSTITIVPLAVGCVVGGFVRMSEKKKEEKGKEQFAIGCDIQPKHGTKLGHVRTVGLFNNKSPKPQANNLESTGIILKKQY